MEQAVCGGFSLYISFRISVVKIILVLITFPELPYGWEKVNDPVYGTYYIE